VIDRVEAPEFDLKAHLRTLWRYRIPIVGFVLVMIAASLAFSFTRSALYRGEVRVLVQRRADQSLSSSGSGTSADPARTVQDEIEVIKSQPIQATVERQFGPVAKVSVSQVAETDFVRVQATSGNERRAGALAKAYATAYIDSRRAQDRDDLTTVTRGVQAKIDGLQSQIDALNKQINDLADRQGPGAGAEVITGLSAQRSQLLSQQGELKQRLDSLEIESPLPSTGAQLVTTGTVPTVKISPRPIQAAIVGGVLGLVVAIGLALLLAYLDDRIHTKEDLESLIGEVPVLGLIPVLPHSDGDGTASIASVVDPESIGAEAFRNLITILQFIGVERQPKVLQITSPNAEDGKSTLLANLAAAMAGAGQRVAVVDCDLRRGRLHQLFGLSSATGFTGVFQRTVELDEALQPVPGVDGLDLLASGPLPPNPAALLLAKRTAEVVNDLQERYDIVLVDCPPLLPVADSVALSAWVDGTILVVAGDATTRRDLRRTLEILEGANAPLIGVVLNRTSSESHYGYPYRYDRDEERSGRSEDVAGRRRPDPSTPSRPAPTDGSRRSVNGTGEAVTPGSSSGGPDIPDRPHIGRRP
jgi:capsular exopolysaccharide synthesis family protein